MTSSASGSHKILVSDCEGPISRNDNAFELADHFISGGDRLFTLISRYDDILADIVKREGYKAGDTLKLILPFLKAYDVTNEMMTGFSSRNILLMPGAGEMLEFVRRLMPAYIVSTSYEQYMRALCGIISFPFESVYCTRLDLYKYSVPVKEKGELKHLAEEMIRLPMLEISHKVQSSKTLTPGVQEIVQRLDEIFWKEIAHMKAGQILREVNPVGGSEKATAVKDIVIKEKGQLQDVVYIGDSITDVTAFRLIRDGGGLTVSFNGNSYAVREAEIAVLSENAVVSAVLADLFGRMGKARLMALVREWNPHAMEKFSLYEPMKRCFLRLCRRKFPKVELITEKNMEKLAQESTEFRKSVRGEAIGKLG